MSSYRYEDIKLDTFHKGEEAFQAYDKTLKDFFKEKEYWLYKIVDSEKFYLYIDNLRRVYEEWSQYDTNYSLMRDIELKLERFIFDLIENLLREYKISRDRVLQESFFQIETHNWLADARVKYLLSNIKDYDSELYLKHKALFDKKDNSRQRKKVLFTNLDRVERDITLSRIYRWNLNRLYRDIEKFAPKELKDDFQRVISKKMVSKDIYSSLFQKIVRVRREFIIKKALVNAVIDALKLTNLLEIDREDIYNRLLKNRVASIHFKEYQEYIIALKLDGVNLISKFVKVTDSKEITDSQKIIDKEILNNWCFAMENRDVLRIMGQFNIKHRVEEPNKIHLVSKENFSQIKSRKRAKSKGEQLSVAKKYLDIDP